MTNQVALASKLLVPVPDEALEIALIDRGYDPATQYSESQIEGVELALLDLLVSILTNPDISEGGYSIKNPDREKIKARIVILATKYEEADVLAQFTVAAPTIKRIAPW